MSQRARSNRGAQNRPAQVAARLLATEDADTDADYFEGRALGTAWAQERATLAICAGWRERPITAAQSHSMSFPRCWSISRPTPSGRSTLTPGWTRTLTRIAVGIVDAATDVYLAVAPVPGTSRSSRTTSASSPDPISGRTPSPRRRAAQSYALTLTARRRPKLPLSLACRNAQCDVVSQSLGSIGTRTPAARDALVQDTAAQLAGLFPQALAALEESLTDPRGQVRVRAAQLVRRELAARYEFGIALEARLCEVEESLTSRNAS